MLRAALAVLLLAVLLAAIGPRHEPWFDEAQAWLLGRDGTLWDLLAHRVRYEGSPGLWHAMLWFLSHAGLPFASLWLVSATLACLGAWIVLRHAPFPFWLRLGVVFSYFFAYQYAVVARSYALALLFIPLIAATYASRMRRPLIYCVLLGLCANFSAHSFIVASLLFGEFLFACWRNEAWRDRAVFLACAVFAILGGAAVLQAWPPADVSFASRPWSLAEFYRVGMMIREAMVDRFDVLFDQQPTHLSQTVGGWLSMVLLLPSFLLFKRAGHLNLMAALFAALLIFSVIEYANVWHAGMFYLVWIFGLWISWQALPQVSARFARIVLSAVAAIVLLNDSYTGAAWWRELRQPYSAGPAAARILAAEPEASIAAAGFKAFAVQPWFNKNAFANYRNGAPEVAYFRWTTGARFRGYMSLDTWRTTVATARYGTLVLSTSDMTPATIAQYRDAANAAGFCAPVTVAGGLIWKSYVREDDTLLIFKRCPSSNSKSAR